MDHPNEKRVVDSQAGCCQTSQDDSEECLCEMIAGTFRGRMCCLTIAAWVLALALAVLAVLSAVWFFVVKDTRGWILCATLFLVLVGCVGSIKMWYWMLLNRNCVLRQIKLLEQKLTGRPPGQQG